MLDSSAYKRLDLNLSHDDRLAVLLSVFELFSGTVCTYAADSGPSALGGSAAALRFMLHVL